jgi:hypothetical protein
MVMYVGRASSVIMSPASRHSVGGVWQGCVLIQKRLRLAVGGKNIHWAQGCICLHAFRQGGVVVRERVQFMHTQLWRVNGANLQTQALAKDLFPVFVTERLYSANYWVAATLFKDLLAT